ncbi:MAG: YceD family protein [Eubacterium sp.]
MLFDISDILSVTGKTSRVETEISMKYFENRIGKYPFKDGGKAELTFTYLGNRKVMLDAYIKATLIIPCDRCLDDVNTDFNIKVSKEIDMNDADEDSENSVYFDGTVFDTEAFVYDEILVHLPMKVLCKENCAGICNICGANLNKGSCDCKNDELDPRMSKILDVFNQFKEV